MSTQSNNPAPAYLLANLALQDVDAYLKDYAFPVVPTLLEVGAEILVATPQVHVLEGDYQTTWTVVIRFPSQEVAEQWYDSDAYRPLIPVRQGLTDQDASTMVLAPQFVMPDA